MHTDKSDCRQQCKNVILWVATPNIQNVLRIVIKNKKKVKICFK